MAYKSTKPEANDKLKDSQSDIQVNFAAIKTAFDVNHEALTGTGGNEGKHKFVNLTNQTAIGDAASAADQMTLFERVPITPAITALQTIFAVRDTSAAANTRYIPLTAGSNEVTHAFSVAAGTDNHGYSFLGSGLCMKFGNVSLGTLGGALNNNTQRNTTLPLTNAGPNFLATTKYISALLTFAPENSFNFGANNTMLYIRWSACTNTVLGISIANQTGAQMPANTRIMYQVIGQVDLTTT
jgi:hypothetical protein